MELIRFHHFMDIWPFDKSRQQQEYEETYVQNAYVDFTQDDYSHIIYVCYLDTTNINLYYQYRLIMVFIWLKEIILLPSSNQI